MLCPGYVWTEIPHGQVSKFGSIPAQFLYNWVFVCVSMVEHSRKMKAGVPKENEEAESSDGLAAKLTEAADVEADDDKTEVQA